MSTLWERLHEIQAQGPDAEDTDEAEDLRFLREQERRGEIPYPMCCIDAAGSPVVYPSLKGNLNGPPIWMATHHDHGYPRSVQVLRRVAKPLGLEVFQSGPLERESW